MGWVQLFSKKAHYTSRAARGGCGSIKKKQIKVSFILCLYHVRKATSQCDAQTEVFVWPFFLVVHGCVSTVCSRWWCKNPFDVLRWVVHRFVMQRVHAPCPCHGFFLYLRNSRGQHLTPSTCVGKRFFSKKLFEVYVQDESHGLGLMACKPFSLLLEEAFFQAFRIFSPLLGPNDLCVPSFFLWSCDLPWPPFPILRPHCDGHLERISLAFPCRLWWAAICLQKDQGDKLAFAPIPFSQQTRAFFQALRMLLLPSLLGFLYFVAFLQAVSLLLVFSLQSLCLRASLQVQAFFQAFAFQQIPLLLLSPPFPIDLCSWPSVFPKWTWLAGHALLAVGLQKPLVMPTWLGTLPNPRLLQKVQASKSWPSCRPHHLQLKKKHFEKSWPSCRPGMDLKTKQSWTSWISWLSWPSCRPADHQNFPKNLGVEGLLSRKHLAKTQLPRWLSFAPLWLPAYIASVLRGLFSTSSHGWEGRQAGLQSYLPTSRLSIRWCYDYARTSKCIVSTALLRSRHLRFCKNPSHTPNWSAHLWHLQLVWLFFSRSPPAWTQPSLWHRLPCQWCFVTHQCPLAPH